LLALCTRILMAKKTTGRGALSLRKTPLQRRSTETVAIILEAAARILERHGFASFNTNAIAERAGVSIGSLYQYFPNKDALLSGLLEREVAPFLAVCEELTSIKNCRAALRGYIRSSMQHQMRRPKLARLIDQAEARETFQGQVSGTLSRLQAVIEEILKLPDAPPVSDRRSASADVLTVIRSLVDEAGQRHEGESVELVRRVEGAVWGYLKSCDRALPMGKGNK
jgi:AcrR family transcriptional regulator